MTSVRLMQQFEAYRVVRSGKPSTLMISPRHLIPWTQIRSIHNDNKTLIASVRSQGYDGASTIKIKELEAKQDEGKGNYGVIDGWHRVHACVYLMDEGELGEDFKVNTSVDVVLLCGTVCLTPHLFLYRYQLTFTDSTVHLGWLASLPNVHPFSYTLAHEQTHIHAHPFIRFNDYYFISANTKIQLIYRFGRTSYFYFN
jgi:hypothetical protein